MGGTERKGVFSTRSSFRPNALAISSVKVLNISTDDAGFVQIEVVGADLVDETPIYQVIPYDPQTDCIAFANSSWAKPEMWPMLEDVYIAPETAQGIDANTLKGIKQALLLDPRPAYTRSNQPEREFWVPIANMAIFFKVNGSRASVTQIVQLNDEQLARLKAKGTLSEFEKETS